MKLLQFPTNARLFDSALRIVTLGAFVEIQCPTVGTVRFDAETLGDLRQHLMSSETARECTLLIRRSHNTAAVSEMIWKALHARPGKLLSAGAPGTRLFDRVPRCLVGEGNVELHLCNSAGESTTFNLSLGELFAVAVAVDMAHENFSFADRFRMRYAGSDKVSELLDEAMRTIEDEQNCVHI